MDFRRKLYSGWIGAACLLPLAFTFAIAGNGPSPAGLPEPDTFALSALKPDDAAGGTAAYQGGDLYENTEPAVQTSRERLLVLFCATLLEVGKEPDFSLTPSQAEQLAGIVRRSIGQGEMTQEESEEAKHLLTGRQRDRFEKIFADDAKRSLQRRALETGRNREHCGETAPDFYEGVSDGEKEPAGGSPADRQLDCGPVRNEPELSLEQQTLQMLNALKTATITGRDK
ncbi:hypothetical protein [Paenibacillus sp. UNC499MF]|uniref:hypothetical protein n=1 Tax=Paenibacillus sp. UNC499MF TaxID=1502751 RepID=UPI0008A05FB8|nr:hypothetical protein [Paenibacillus sp. UNC499MF]SEG07156.1 hypothetical protein SAMN02799616_01744 [Paenibacillus sp. UNC499MF]